MPVGLWSITDERPRRMEQRHDWLEAQLEQWILREPSLVADGLRWIGQQVTFPDRTRLDLLGMTREGGVILAELKRGVLGIAALSQALHYVLWLGSLEPDALLARLDLSDDDARALTDAVQGEGGLDVSVLLIGTGRAPELDRAAAFLAASGLSIPVSIVTFTPFVDTGGAVFLTRETEDHDVAAEDTTPRQQTGRSARVEWVLDLSGTCGVHKVFETVLATAADLGLRVKPWTKSITVVPPTTKGRTLVYFGPRPAGEVHFGYSEETLAELYGADPAEVRDLFGANWVNLSGDEALLRLDQFRGLMHALLAVAADGTITDDLAVAEPPPESPR